MLDAYSLRSGSFWCLDMYRSQKVCEHNTVLIEKYVFG